MSTAKKNMKQEAPKSSSRSSSLRFLALGLLAAMLSTYYVKKYSFNVFESLKNGVFSPVSSEGKEFYSFSAKDIKSNTVKFNRYQGKLVLVVNVASECSFTSQYSGLQKLYVDLNNQGLEVVAFPSDQFSQELESEKEIYDFTTSTFGITFTMMSKVTLNGDGAHPLYKFLTKSQPGVLGFSSIKWNFEKFLVNREGKVIARYSSIFTPEKIRADIEKQLRL